MKKVVVVLLASVITLAGIVSAQGPYTTRDEIAVGAHYSRQSYGSSSLHNLGTSVSLGGRVDFAFSYSTDTDSDLSIYGLKGALYPWRQDRGRYPLSVSLEGELGKTEFANFWGFGLRLHRKSDLSNRVFLLPAVGGMAGSWHKIDVVMGWNTGFSAGVALSAKAWLVADISYHRFTSALRGLDTSESVRLAIGLVWKLPRPASEIDDEDSTFLP